MADRFTISDPRQGPGEHHGSGAPRREPPQGGPSPTEQARLIQDIDEAQRRRAIDAGVAEADRKAKEGRIPAV